ncbi:hypothetical protein SDC9_114447 [bioreactor metagenome]|uniref:Uncharacterized protein n=1 Tax=bioreactor metagenome TaxID=1076179 RepID=A0A645C0M5_9ZZZZ
MASSVNLAATSATLSAPFVITINCTMTIMRNMINPTTGFPPITYCPKAFMTFPAFPPFPRINLVEDTLSETLSNVDISKTDGNTENSRGSLICIVISSIIIDSDMFMISIASSSIVPNGIIIRNIMPIIKIVRMLSNAFFIFAFTKSAVVYAFSFFNLYKKARISATAL